MNILKNPYIGYIGLIWKKKSNHSRVAYLKMIYLKMM